MGTVSANDLTFHYETAGSGDPLILIPYLAADHACYAFQLSDYTKHFTCVAVDLRGSGLTDKPAGPYSTEQFGDDIAAFMAALGIDRAHVAGVSLGAVTATWLAIKHADRVASLSIHSGWTKTDPFLRAVVEGWRLMARSLDTVADMVIQGIFPWAFTPEAYANEEFIAGLSDFVRGRPPQPLEAFLSQSDAVLGHDFEAQLGRITAPTQVTFGRWDLVTSTRFEPAFTAAIKGAELVVFDDCSHAGLHQNPAEFNSATLDFLTRQRL
jgi:pimeloyl-ACP methyl ester carboxylesterase